MRLMPTLVSAGVGFASAALRKQDIDKSRTQLSNQWGSYFEFGLPVLVVLAEMSHMYTNPDITEAAFHSGVALASERVSRSALGGSFGAGSPYAARAIGAPYAPPMARMMAGSGAYASPAVLRQASGTLR